MPRSPFPKELRRTFHVQTTQRVATEDGYRTDFADASPARIFVGIIADADTRTLMIAQQQGFVLSAVVISSEAPMAGVGDRLRCEEITIAGREIPERFFKIERVDDPADMGRFAIYYTEQVSGGSGGTGG